MDEDAQSSIEDFSREMMGIPFLFKHTFPVPEIKWRSLEKLFLKDREDDETKTNSERGTTASDKGWGAEVSKDEMNYRGAET